MIGLNGSFGLAGIYGVGEAVDFSGRGYTFQQAAADRAELNPRDYTTNQLWSLVGALNGVIKANGPGTELGAWARAQQARLQAAITARTAPSETVQISESPVTAPVAAGSGGAGKYIPFLIAAAALFLLFRK